MEYSNGYITVKLPGFYYIYAQVRLFPFLKAHKPPILANFLSTTFYDLKLTFGYIGESPENFMSKYTQEV